MQYSEEEYNLLIEHIPDVIWTIDQNGAIRFISPKIIDFCGFSQQEFYEAGKRLWFGRIYPADTESVKEAYRLLFKSNRQFNIEYRVARKDGGIIWLNDRAVSIYDKDGIKHANGIFSDITIRKQAIERLRKSKASLTNAQRIARMGNWEWDIIKNELSWSDEIYRIFGIEPQAFAATYEAFLNSVHPDDRGFVKESVNKALSGNMPYSIDHRILLPDGTVRIVHEQAEVAFDCTGRAVQMNGTVQDVTEHRLAVNELRKLSLIIEQSVNTVFITDLDGNIEYVNPMFGKVTGYHKEEVIGKNPSILASGETSAEEYRKLWNTIKSGKTWRGVFKNRKKSGEYYWGKGVITPIADENGKISHFLAVQEDITEQRLSQERIRRLTTYDGLVEVFNRTHFIDLLQEWISHAEVYGRQGVLLLTNIDSFRLINDTYGTGVGDSLLHHVASLFKKILSDIEERYKRKYKDIVKSILGRMGGDEFAIFMPSMNKNDGKTVAEYIRKKVELFQFVEATESVTISIGGAIYPEHGVTTQDLFTRADASVYHAKELGKNRLHFYQPEDRILEKIHSKITGKDRLLKAIKEGRIIPWFQPIMDLRDGKIHHYEALARMQDVDGSIILPSEFIYIAETFGLITVIDKIIIEKTMLLASKLSEKGAQLSFAMNLSGKEFGDKELLNLLKTRIVETNVNPHTLVFEITETSAIREFDTAVQFIEDLKSLGCAFSLDDFGVGFTSFKYLQEMDVDYIKIDGSFINKLSKNQNDRLFVKSIVDVAKGMGIKTIAEFVENNETVDILKDYGVDYAQGYLIGKPAPDIKSIC